MFYSNVGAWRNKGRIFRHNFLLLIIFSLLLFEIVTLLFLMLYFHLTFYIVYFLGKEDWYCYARTTCNIFLQPEHSTAVLTGTAGLGKAFLCPGKFIADLFLGDQRNSLKLPSSAPQETKEGQVICSSEVALHGKGWMWKGISLTKDGNASRIFFFIFSRMLNHFTDW